MTETTGRRTAPQSGLVRKPSPSELPRPEALALLDSVPIGRVLFSHQALPAVRLVNHVVVDEDVVIRTHAGAALLGSAQDGAVVAYQADEVDLVRRCGWSVTVTGVATLVRDAEAQRRYGEMLHPWVGGRMDQVVRISIDYLTGLRFG
ncbi:pyridoxamine 5'-phosphate oxidase family protein [Streptomyces sulphureus]|uniref:pyridoxamine 5'-phosphate oxidase family protein n=1 Tax=Streptomyces sulphureus TaxID=47758 RepID=UPI0003817805|nr:pyridoxamine 5'-phosphate oxidase family protein [Streptomyces sulphureus]